MPSFFVNNESGEKERQKCSEEQGRAVNKELVEARQEMDRWKKATADWKMKHFMAEKEVKAKHDIITHRDTRITELEEKCGDLEMSLVNQVRNTGCELGKMAVEGRAQVERREVAEARVREVELELELLGEERRRREEEWGRVVGDVEGRSRLLNEEVGEAREEMTKMEEERSSLRAKNLALEREHQREVEELVRELEESRSGLTKRIQQLEEQVGEEQDKRARLAREKRSLEGQLGKAKDNRVTEELVSKLRADLRKKTVLLRDAQVVIEKQQGEGSSRLLVRQLKVQLEEAEQSRTVALRARRHGEQELEEAQQHLEEGSRARARLQEKLTAAQREAAEVASRLQDGEEELAEVMKKYRASVAALGTDQITLQDQELHIQELEGEGARLREDVVELQGRLELLEGESVAGNVRGNSVQTEGRLLELEHKLELEAASRVRLESQVCRLREQRDRLEKVWQQTS